MAGSELPADGASSRACSACGQAPTGPGGILCEPCAVAIAALGPADWYGQEPA
jgi:hypothetical protein